MKAALLRTGSVPIQLHSFVPGSPRVSLSVHDSVAGVFSGDKNGSTSPRISLHLDAGRRRDSIAPSGIRRALSESDMTRPESDFSGGFSRLSGVGSRSFTARIPEEYVSEGDEEVGGIGSLILNERDFHRRNYAGDSQESGIPVEELGFPGGGVGKGKKFGRGGGGEDCRTATFNSGNSDRSKIGACYQEILKSNPTNSLLLRNYGRFLHEVERDMVKAEEYYGRALLASPGDGEVLSLYGNLIWETKRDEYRAKSYFDQAVHASPNDCMVLGSYAHFMWEVEEEEDEEDDDDDDDIIQRENKAVAAAVEAF